MKQITEELRQKNLKRLAEREVISRTVFVYECKTGSTRKRYIASEEYLVGAGYKYCTKMTLSRFVDEKPNPTGLGIHGVWGYRGKSRGKYGKKFYKV